MESYILATIILLLLYRTPWPSARSSCYHYETLPTGKETSQALCQQYSYRGEKTTVAAPYSMVL